MLLAGQLMMDLFDGTAGAVPTLQLMYPLYSWWAPRVLDKPLATMPPPPLLLFSSSWEADGELSKQ